MNKKIKLVLLVSVSIFLLTGCFNKGVSESGDMTERETTEKITYDTVFYTNQGIPWLSINCNSFDLKANKQKQYGYNSDGHWDSWYETSSIISVSLDENKIDSCGSSIIFSDNRLEKYDISDLELTNLKTTSDETGICEPGKLEWKDYFTLQLWWKTSDLANKYSKGNARLLVCQSQEGNNITAFIGKNVDWDIPELPKTTKVMIDEKPVYLHRLNFAIIDISLLENLNLDYYKSMK